MNTGLMELAVVVLFAICTLIQFFYYLIYYIKFIHYKPVEDSGKQEPLTVVICARNEQENLAKNLPSILEQDYFDYEVVVVNDCSEDDTEDVLTQLKIKYPHLRSTFIKRDEKFGHGKKLALTIGIKSAQNEYVVLTDADCIPQSDQWLNCISKNFSDKKKIVLGYGGYKTEPGFLNMLIRFDAVIIALQYMSYALAGRPYMGVGRNLAYNKSLFFANKGFASHARLSSGDDDLFVNEVATAENVAIEPFFNSHTRTQAKKTFENWIDQKKRHFTTFPKYKKVHKFLLGAENFSRVIFYFSMILLLVLQHYWLIAVLVFLVRLTIQLFVFNKVFIRFNEKNLLLISPIFDLIFPFINLGVYISNILIPRKQWR